MAGRRPVVATKVEGVEELLGPLADGQTVAYGDSHCHAERIVDFMTSSEKAAVIGAENRRRPNWSGPSRRGMPAVPPWDALR